MIAALMLAFRPGPAAAQDDDYLRVYDLIQQADALGTNQPAAALAKYRAVRMELRQFQRDYPDWNRNVVSFRLNYLADRITALSDQIAYGGTSNAVASKAATTGSAPVIAARPHSPASGLQVKLLEPGSEPRSELRLHPKAGDRQQMAMTLKMGMEMKMGEAAVPAMKLPPIEMSMSTTVRDVATNGDITYEMVLGESSVEDDEGAGPPLGEVMKTSLDSLKGFSSVVVVSSRGLPRKAEFKTPTGADPQIQQMMGQMKDSLSQFSVPFPEEPVGVGAKWEVNTPIKSQGMTLQQDATYELVSKEGERIVLRSVMTQRAANQKIQSPAAPGVRIELTRMAGRGTSEATYDLGQLMPSRGAVNLHSDMDMAMGNGAQQQKMAMKMDFQIGFQAK